MGRPVSVGIVLCALGLASSAPQSSAPLRQSEVRDGIGELRRSVHDAAAFLVKVQPEEINDEALFFEGQRRRLSGVVALARCVESVNDTLPATQEKAHVASSLRALVAELSEAARGITSLERAHQSGSLLLASKAFDAFDKAQARPAVGVGEAIAP
jgi:hypothetical protein